MEYHVYERQLSPIRDRFILAFDQKEDAIYFQEALFDNASSISGKFYYYTCHSTLNKTNI